MILDALVARSPPMRAVALRTQHWVYDWQNMHAIADRTQRTGERQPQRADDHDGGEDRGPRPRGGPRARGRGGGLVRRSGLGGAAAVERADAYVRQVEERESQREKETDTDIHREGHRETKNRRQFFREIRDQQRDQGVVRKLRVTLMERWRVGDYTA